MAANQDTELAAVEAALGKDATDAAVEAALGKDATDAAVEAALGNGDSKLKQPGRALIAAPGSVYDRIADPMAFVAQFGVAIYESKMFGCANAHQGRVLAMTCFCEGLNPLEIKRRYHIIGGQLAMRADAMLAEFRMNFGGSHDIIERTPEVAAVRLNQRGRECVAKFTWEDAQKEPFVWDKKNTPKTNWATPRARMQMLWARVVSDAVRAFCPEVVSGVYTPEELGCNGDIEDAEFTVVRDGATPHSATSPASPAPAKEPRKAKPETKPAPAETKLAASETKPPATETKPADAGEMSSAGETADPAPTKASREILVEIKRLKTGLEYGDEMWAKILKKFEVKSALELDSEQAEKLRHWLADKLKAKTGVDELSAWANGAMAKGGKD